MLSFREKSRPLLKLSTLLALMVFSASTPCIASTSPVLCNTLGTSLQFEVINPLTLKQQQGRGHIKIHCRNQSNTNQHITISVFHKNQNSLTLKKNNNSEITLKLFIDEHYQIPLSNRSGGNPLKLEGLVTEQAESYFEIPFFAQITFPKIPEAGEHVLAAEFELLYQPISARTEIRKIGSQPDR